VVCEGPIPSLDVLVLHSTELKLIGCYFLQGHWATDGNGGSINLDVTDIQIAGIEADHEQM
jgi:hypothetical protein